MHAFKTPLVIALFAAVGVLLLQFGSADNTQPDQLNTQAQTAGLPEDINGDGVVGIIDLSQLLGKWGATAQPQDPAPVGQDGADWSLVFADEFEGTEIDTSVWGYQEGTWGGGTPTQNCYVPENSIVNSGVLQIISKYEPGYRCPTATRDFTSGFIQTRGKAAWTYGYFEARIRMPDSDSTWPAFWLSPNDAVYGSWPRSGEIDILEAKGHDTTTAYADAHWGESSTNKRNWTRSYDVGDITQWHTYALKWSEGSLQYYIDGNLYHTINDFKDPNATEHPGPFDKDFYIRLNNAVGGRYLDPPYHDANNSIDQLPATMEVDYVRVWQ